MAVIAFIAVLSLVLPMAAALIPPARGAEARPATQTSAVPGPVVVLGMTGVAWTDVSGPTTPALWELGTIASGANLVVRSQRSSSCPADGWLAISAGVRASDVPMDDYGACRRLRTPGESGTVPGWADYLAAADAGDYAARPGTLGDALAGAGTAARGIGAGAAIALATGEGVPVGPISSLPSSAQGLGEATRATLAEDPSLLVVDVGSLRDSNRPLVPVADTSDASDVPAVDPAQDSVFADLGQSDDEGGSLVERFAQPSRESQLIAIDSRVDAVLSAVREQAPDATVIVASLSDSGTRAGLRLAAGLGPGITEDTPGADTPEGPGLLTANSTRQAGYVQTFDIPATVLDDLGIEPPAAMSGSRLVTDPDTVVEPGESQHHRITHLADDVRHAAAVPPAAPTFTIVLIAANLLVYAAATVGLNRRVLTRVAQLLRLDRERTASPAMPRNIRHRGARRALRVLRAVALAVAALPISATLANLVPWWRASSTGWALTATIAAFAIAIAAIALLGPWRRWLLGPLGVVTAITAVTLGIDVVTGAQLQIANVLGTQPQVGARFYGINNQSFALFVTSMLLLAMCVAEPLVRAGRRRLAAGIVLLLGAVEVLINGLPSLGADFGGPPAAIPGFLLLALMTAGIRVTWQRVTLIVLAAAAAVSAFAIADWINPPRTHIGNFVQTVIDGGLWDVVSRKLSANLSLLFGTPLTFLAVGGILVVLLVLSQPLRRDHRETSSGDGARGSSSAYGWLTGGPSILRLDRAAIMLRPGILAIAVTLAIGFALNDSGIVIPALGIALMVPLLIAVLMTWLLDLDAAEHERGDASDPASSDDPADPGEPAAGDEARPEPQRAKAR